MRRLRPLLDKVTQTVSSGVCAFRHYPTLPPYIWIPYDFTEISTGEKTLHSKKGGTTYYLHQCKCLCVYMCVFSVSFFWKLLLTCSVWNFFLPVGKVWKIFLLISNRENICKGMRKVFHFSFNTTQWTELVISGNEGSISHKWGMFSITMLIL